MDVPEFPSSQIVPLIDAFLAGSAWTAPKFGRAVLRDPGMVYNFRNGREARRTTINRILAFIENERPGFVEMFRGEQ